MTLMTAFTCPRLMSSLAADRLAIGAAFLYLACAALPMQSNLPLVGLTLCGAVAFGVRASSRTVGWRPLMWSVGAFVCATAVSTTASVHVERSLYLSAPLLPAMMLFVIMTSHMAGLKDVRRLYLLLSAMGLVLATLVLWAAWSVADEHALDTAVAQLRIPMLIVANDIIVLAVIAPLSFILLCREPLSSGGLVAGCSLLLSALAVCVLWSRAAVLTMALTLVSAVAICQCYRVRAFWGSVIPASLLLFILTCLDIRQVSGSSLLSKFREAGLNGRYDDWIAAWDLFLRAPVIGQGPHTFGLFHSPPWPHNVYLEVLAEQGLLGLTAFCSMVVCGIVGGLKIRRARNEDARYLGAGALAGLLGLCGAGFFELTMAREWVVTMLFLLLSVIGYLVAVHIDQREDGQ